MMFPFVQITRLLTCDTTPGIDGNHPEESADSTQLVHDDL